MRYLILLAIFFVQLLPALAQPESPPEDFKVKLESSAKNFVSLLNSRGTPSWQHSLMGSERVWNARQGFFGGHEWFDWWPTNGQEIKFRDLENPQFTGQGANLRATGTLRYALKPPAQPVITDEVEDAPPKMEVPPLEKWPTQSESLTWRWSDKSQSWLIEAAEPTKTEHFYNAPFRWTAYCLAQNDGALEKFRTQLSQHRLKAAGLGILQFVQDFNEKFAFAPEFMAIAVRPYIKDTNVFLRPDNGKPYEFNSFLSGRSNWDIAKAAETVLLYEGEFGQLDFGERGSAAVLFIDGHVELVDSARAKTLVWKP